MASVASLPDCTHPTANAFVIYRNIFMITSCPLNGKPHRFNMPWTRRALEIRSEYTGTTRFMPSRKY